MRNVILITNILLLFAFVGKGQVNWVKRHSPNESFHTIHASANGIVYAGSSKYGLFKSENNGQNWQNISSGLPDSLIREVQVGSDDKVFVGTGTHGVYQFNNGVWSAINGGLPVSNTIVTSFAKAPGGIMYMMNSTGQIYKWNGSIWTNITYNFPTLGKTILVNSQGILFAGAFTFGVYEFNGTNNWTLVGNPMSNNYVLKLAITSTDTLYALCNSNNIFKCSIQGGNWTLVNNGLPALNMNFLAIDNQDHIFTAPASGSPDLYRSENYGNNWFIVSSTLKTTNFRTLYCTPAGLVYTCASGVFLSMDGGDNWQDKNNTLDAPRSIFCFKSKRDGTCYVGTKIGVWRSDDGGLSWKLKNTGLNHLNVLQIIEAADGNLLLHAYNSIPNGAIYRSTNLGDNWVMVAANGCDLYTKLKQHRADTIWAASRFNGATSLSFSVNQGLTWQNNPLDISAIFDIDVTKDNTIFLASESEGVSRSDNGGQTFILGVGGSIPWYGNVLEIERDESGTIFAGGDWWAHALWYSTPGDNGNLWTQFTDPDLLVHGIQDVVFDHDNNIYLACEDGGMRMAYHSDWNSATNFFQSSSGLPSPMTNLLELSFDTSGYLFAIAYTNNALGGGLFRGEMPVNLPKSSVFKFIGNGDWDVVSNWEFQQKPPHALSGDKLILIDPVPGGECLLNGQLQLENGVRLKLRPGKIFRNIP